MTGDTCADVIVPARWAVVRPWTVIRWTVGRRQGGNEGDCSNGSSGRILWYFDGGIVVVAAVKQDVRKRTWWKTQWGSRRWNYRSA